jgi:hypothetical protein
MSTRTKSSYQDPRYLQLWLVFEWPAPTERVPVACAGCGWQGRRCRRSAARRPCPRCRGPVSLRSAVRGRSSTREDGSGNVVPLRARREGTGPGERRVPRMVSGSRVRRR